MRGRHTALWALALEKSTPDDCKELLALLNQETRTQSMLLRVRELYQKANVFETAGRLVDKYQARAEAVADEIEPDELRRLFYYLIDSVLDRAGLLTPVEAAVTPLSLPVAAKDSAE